MVPKVLLVHSWAWLELAWQLFDRPWMFSCLILLNIVSWPYLGSLYRSAFSTCPSYTAKTTS